MKEFFNDDKNLIILSVLILGLALIFTPKIDPGVLKALAPIFTGLFGIAIGRVTKSEGGIKDETTDTKK